MKRFTDNSKKASNLKNNFFGQGLANGQGRYVVERFRGSTRTAACLLTLAHPRRSLGPASLPSLLLTPQLGISRLAATPFIHRP